MKHLAPLDKCACGAYRYITVRERKRSYEVMLIHQVGKVRKYRKVAGIPKDVLDFHRAGNLDLRGGDSLLTTSLQLMRQVSAFVTALRRSDKYARQDTSRDA